MKLWAQIDFGDKIDFHTEAIFQKIPDAYSAPPGEIIHREQEIDVAVGALFTAHIKTEQADSAHAQCPQRVPVLMEEFED